MNCGCFHPLSAEIYRHRTCTAIKPIFAKFIPDRVVGINNVTAVAEGVVASARYTLIGALIYYQHSHIRTAHNCRAHLKAFQSMCFNDTCSSESENRTRTQVDHELP
eukprot:SAG31_NODE_447_length_15579_cov_5.713871_12_plen_107_part_00